MKTRVSFIKEMIIAAATKGLMLELIQMGVVFSSDLGSIIGSGSNISTMKAKHPPRTANHKPAKKAIIHGYVLNTARVRKKNRREVITRVEQ